MGASRGERLSCNDAGLNPEAKALSAAKSDSVDAFLMVVFIFIVFPIRGVRLSVCAYSLGAK